MFAGNASANYRRLGSLNSRLAVLEARGLGPVWWQG